MKDFRYAIACNDSGVPKFFSAEMECTTLEEAQGVCAEFPKYLKLKAIPVLHAGLFGGLASMRVDLGSNDVTGTENETGTKRIKKFFEIAKRLGFNFQCKQYCSVQAKDFGWHE